MAKAVSSPQGSLDLIGDSIAGKLAGLKVDLFQSNIMLTPWPGDAALIAAVATYAGYAQAAVTWGTPSQADDGSYEVIGTIPVFAPTNATTPNNIWGAYFTESGAPHAIEMAVIFDNAPLPMENALRTITIVLRYRPQTGTIVVTVS